MCSWSRLLFLLLLVAPKLAVSTGTAPQGDVSAATVSTTEATAVDRPRRDGKIDDDDDDDDALVAKVKLEDDGGGTTSKRFLKPGPGGGRRPRHLSLEGLITRRVGKGNPAFF